MLPLLLHIGLALQVAPMAAEPAPAAVRSEVGLRRQELRLLHLALDRQVLRAFPVWDGKAGALRDARPAEVLDDSTPVLILHLWATWCEPCREEFALWHTLTPRLSEQHHGRVRVFHIALQDSIDDMPAFVEKMRGKLPANRLYFDYKGALAAILSRALGQKRLVLPMTLFLDPGRVVRQAIIGPMDARRSEVVEATARMLHLVELQEQGRIGPPPSSSSDF